jgi:glycosyltransferase involved in cell wall biosynthesis
MVPIDAVKAMIVSNSLNQGGAERFASRLAYGLNRDRVAPSLVLLRGDITYALPDDVCVEVLGYRRPSDLFKAVVRLRRILRQAPPDVILGAGTSVNVVIGSALIGMQRRPAWIARVDIDRRDLWLRKGILGLLYPRADAIVANSSGLQRAVERIYPRQQKKIRSILNPVDFQQIDHMAGRKPLWTQSTRVPLLISVGRAHPAKRWDLLLEIFAKLVQTTPAELVLCGDGPMLTQLKMKAFKLNIDTRVHFLGHCSNPFSILAQADLFLLNSEAEGLPNALIEAQGLGLCAVSTNCNFGPNEIIEHGQTGFLVDLHDQAQFIESIVQLLGDESLRERMGARARQVVRQRFNFEMRCRQWEELLIKSARHPAG